MWTVEYLPSAVKEEAELPADMQARLGRTMRAVQEYGLFSLPHGWVKPLGDKLWEMRITGRDGIARVIYITATGKRLVVVRIFIKKTQKTPDHEIKLARQRAKEVR